VDMSRMRRTKKTSFVMALLMLLLVLCGCNATMETEVNLEKEVAPYQDEIDTLRQEISDKKVQMSRKSSGQATLVYGYRVENFWEYPWSDESAALVLTPASFDDWDLINTATYSGRTILLMLDQYNEDAIRQAKAALTIDGIVLKGSADSKENRQALVDMGYTLQSSPVNSVVCGVQDNGALNVPFLYVQSDEDSVSGYLDAAADGRYTLFVIFDPEIYENRSTCQSYVSEETLKYETMSQARQRLQKDYDTQMQAQQEGEAYISEREERINELRQIIKEIYLGQ